MRYHVLNFVLGAESREERRKKRKSRWGGDEKEKIFIPGMPTVLPTNLSKEQEEAYLGMLISLIFCRMHFVRYNTSSP